MGIEYALEQLYQSGWSALDTAGCEIDPSGRWAPGVARVSQEFEECGFALTVRHVQLFDCYRAEWSPSAGAAAGQPAGAVVGQSEREAGVYALAQLRRAMATAGR